MTIKIANVAPKNFGQLTLALQLYYTKREQDIAKLFGWAKAPFHKNGIKKDVFVIDTDAPGVLHISTWYDIEFRCKPEDLDAAIDFIASKLKGSGITATSGGRADYGQKSSVIYVENAGDSLGHKPITLATCRKLLAINERAIEKCTRLGESKGSSKFSVHSFDRKTVATRPEKVKGKRIMYKVVYAGGKFVKSPVDLSDTNFKKLVSKLGLKDGQTVVIQKEEQSGYDRMSWGYKSVYCGKDGTYIQRQWGMEY